MLYRLYRLALLTAEIIVGFIHFSGVFVLFIHFCWYIIENMMHIL